MKRSDISNCYGFEGYDSPQTVSSQSEAIELSQKIIEILNGKSSSHNDEFDRKVTVSKLKDVFKAGAHQKQPSDKGTKCQFAIARVNMFLDMMSNAKIKEVYEKSELELVYGQEIDYFNNIVINAKYLDEAQEELDSFGIGGLDFNNADEDLFLETDETPLSLILEI